MIPFIDLRKNLLCLFAKDLMPEISILPEDQMVIRKNLLQVSTQGTLVKATGSLSGPHGYEIYIACIDESMKKKPTQLARSNPSNLVLSPAAMKIDSQSLNNDWQLRIVHNMDLIVRVYCNAEDEQVIDEVNLILTTVVDFFSQLFV